jgi:hypothetical protein
MTSARLPNSCFETRPAGAPQHEAIVYVLVLRSGPKDRVSKDGSVSATEP